MNTKTENAIKVPELTIAFWIIKILATTLGETAGDAVSMSMNLGYLVGSAIFLSIFIVIVALQIRSKNFRPTLYWATIIATTTVGTTMADFADRSLGIGYSGGSLLLLCLLANSLYIWYKTQGSISVASISNRKSEIFYWVTIMFSQTLGTALGDWVADTNGLGYLYSAIIFTTSIAAIGIANYTTKISKTVLFWAAFVLTRPLGAVVGDFLDKPIAKGGLNLDRFSASFALISAIILISFFVKQRAAKMQH